MQLPLLTTNREMTNLYTSAGNKSIPLLATTSNLFLRSTTIMLLGILSCYIIQTMRREDQERFLQSKYPAKASLKDRPRTPGLVSQPRITLSDLPPEEKLKIGELIKINESRRVEIAQLTEQLSSSQSALADCHSQFLQLQLSHEQASQQLKQTLSLLDATEIRHRKEVQQLNLQFQAQVESRKAEKQESRGCQTGEKETMSQSAQTKQRKTRSEGVQTEEEVVGRQKSNRSHSRSLQNKKGKRQKSVSNQQSSFNHSRRTQVEPYQEAEVEQDVDQCFEDLTKKWLQLKEHNLSQLKQSYLSSKQKCPQVEEKTPAQAPRQFTEPSDPDQIDDNELNRLLKSKDFSASRLLNGKGDRQSYYLQSLNTEQTMVGQRRQVQQLPRKEYPLNIANKRDATGSISAVSRREEMKLSVFGNDNDLMDLVDSLS